MDIIELEGMEFKAYHGCLEKERKEGNVFMVDFTACLDLSPAAGSDDIKDTLDYGAVYDIIAKEMETPSNLLENVAGRIADSIQAEFPGILNFKVRVSKKNPPVNGPAAWARITIER